MTARRILPICILLVSVVLAAAQAPTHEITVYKTATCSCCGLWVAHLRENGFRVQVHEVESTAEFQRKFGVPAGLKSCHTATVAGYTLEGHVPASEVQRLLKERPQAKGLAVPGMPIGSPGMEVGDQRAAYSVLLFDAAGKTTVYRRYTAR